MVDFTRKAQGTEVEFELAYLFQDFNYMVELHQSNRDKSNIQQAAMALLPEFPYGGMNIIMPDMTCWKDGPGFIIEVKSKYPTNHDQYGLDCKRLHHLLRYQKMTKVPALYVIYDTRLANGTLQDRSAFLYATVDDLDKSKPDRGQCYYWPTDLFKPLIPFLADRERTAQHDASLSEGIIAPSIILPHHHGAGGTATMH